MTQTLTRTPSATIEEGAAPITIKLEPAIKLTEEQFAAFCEQNRDVRIERTAEGMLELMPPTFSFTGNKNIKITTQLENWTSQNGGGFAFGSSAGFTLPNGAVRSPDASWLSTSRLDMLTEAGKDGFMQICPDFVVELRSRSDRLTVLQAKMDEYMANGARLGWLLDPLQRRARIYRPQAQVEILDNPDAISADPELPGFTLDLKPIWDPAF